MSNVEEIKDIHKVLHDSLVKVKEEMEDHLEAINSNTNEIMSNYEYLCQIDARLAKVEEKIDDLLLASGIHATSRYHDFKMPRLTKNEQELFDFLVAQERVISYRELAFKLALSQTLLSDYMAGLIAKSIPVSKRYSGSDILVSLDPKFQDEMLSRQASRQKVNV